MTGTGLAWRSRRALTRAGTFVLLCGMYLLIVGSSHPEDSV